MRVRAKVDTRALAGYIYISKTSSRLRSHQKFGLPAPSDGAIGFFISAGSIPLFYDIGLSYHVKVGRSL
jgi:hypothetical protein